MKIANIYFLISKGFNNLCVSGWQINELAGWIIMANRRDIY